MVPPMVPGIFLLDTFYWRVCPILTDVFCCCLCQVYLTVFLHFMYFLPIFRIFRDIFETISCHSPVTHHMAKIDQFLCYKSIPNTMRYLTRIPCQTCSIKPKILKTNERLRDFTPENGAIFSLSLLPIIYGRNSVAGFVKNKLVSTCLHSVKIIGFLSAFSIVVSLLPPAFWEPGKLSIFVAIPPPPLHISKLAIFICK